MIAESMERIVELGAEWLSLVALATWRALPILCLVWALVLIFGRRLTPATHALLWTIAVARLLLPVSAGAPWSLHGPLNAWVSQAFEADPQQPLERPFQFGHAERADAASELISWHPTDTPQRPVPNSQSSRMDVTGGLAALLMLISATLVLRGVIAHIRFAMRLRSCRQLESSGLTDMLLRECDVLGVGRRPIVRDVPELSAPAVFGLVRPTICLPASLIETLSSQELRLILRHELAHIRRRDIWVIVAASIATACHWFNPLVWISVRRLRAAVESAADRLAIDGLSTDEAAAYGSLLLRIATNGTAPLGSPTLGFLSFASSNRLKPRIEQLLDRSASRGTWAKRSATVLVAALALTGLTDARGLGTAEVPEVHLPTTDFQLTRPRPIELDRWQARVGDGPAFARQYDIGAILKTMPAAMRADGQDLKSPLIAWIPGLAGVSPGLRVEGSTLFADLNARQHELLAQTLEVWRNGEPRQLVVETRFIQTSIRQASSIDWSARRVDNLQVQGLRPAMAAHISEQQLSDLVRAVSSDRRGNVMFAPKVTCFDGQTATIADQIQRPFVTSVEPNADGSLRGVVSLLDDGLQLTVTPRADDEDGVNLEFDVDFSSIRDVAYANLPVQLPSQQATHVTVQVPAVEHSGASSTVHLVSGESIVIALPRTFSLEPGADSETLTLVTLTPKILAREKSDNDIEPPRSQR